MEAWMIIIGVVALLGAITLILAYICYRMTFLAKRIDTPRTPEQLLPKGEIYKPYWDQILAWIKECRQLNPEEVWITSIDGLRLCGKYYEYSPDAPMEIMFHGYRGNAEGDLCGGVQRAFQLGRSALVVDQRTSGKSEGHVIGFGITESKDCLEWARYASLRWPNRPLILTGISMGAATVMTAAGMDLPKQVAYVLADCGYSCAKDVIKHVIASMQLPPNLCYPFVRLGAYIYGHFRLEETSPIESLRQAKVPVIFFHGEKDNFVPYDMSKENYEACITHKRLVSVPEAGHGQAFLVDPEGYLQNLAQFTRECGVECGYYGHSGENVIS